MSEEQNPNLRLLNVLTTMKPQEFLDFQLSEADQERASYLTERNKAGILSSSETSELEQMLEFDVLVSLFRAKALKNLKSAD